MRLSQTDKFNVEDLIQILEQEPFLLPDIHIETLLIYVFDTEDLESNISINS